MNLTDEYIESLIAVLSPNHKSISIKSLNCECSNNLIVDINQGERSIFIKCQKGNDDTRFIHEINSIFMREKKAENISAPLIYLVDHEKKVVVMDYIKGPNLKQLFISIKQRDQYKLKRMVDLSAIALAEFHKIFMKVEYAKGEDDLKKLVKKKDMNFINECIKRCNLNFKTQLFFDFKFENILFDDDTSELYLIDFPNKKLIYTPHYDIAEFRRDIFIFSQHPQFILFSKWKNPSDIYNQFLSTYCRNLGIMPNESDELIINYFSNTMINYMLKLCMKHKFENLNIIKYPLMKRAQKMNNSFKLNDINF